MKTKTLRSSMAAAWPGTMALLLFMAFIGFDPVLAFGDEPLLTGALQSKLEEFGVGLVNFEEDGVSVNTNDGRIFVAWDGTFSVYEGDKLKFSGTTSLDTTDTAAYAMSVSYTSAGSGATNTLSAIVADTPDEGAINATITAGEQTRTELVDLTTMSYVTQEVQGVDVAIVTSESALSGTLTETVTITENFRMADLDIADLGEIGGSAGEPVTLSWVMWIVFVVVLVITVYLTVRCCQDYLVPITRGFGRQVIAPAP